MTPDPMTAVPPQVRRLVDEREAARAAKDFTAADALRERIHEAGFAVTDAVEGPVLALLQPDGPGAAVPAVLRPPEVVNLLDQPPAFDFSAQWVVQGWPEDVLRGIESFRPHVAERTVQHVVVDVTGESTGWPDDADVVRLEPGTGWGAARNVGLVRTLGRVVMVLDGSVEATGDVLAPLERALAEPGVGVTGPFGIITEGLHHFHESSGPDVDAVEGYLMAFGRELLTDGLRFDEKFKFYRTADIEFSFQVKARGLRATVTPSPVIKHEHRMWANTPDAERDRLSKRNYYRFLDRWRGRTDLTVAGGSAG